MALITIPSPPKPPPPHPPTHTRPAAEIMLCLTKLNITGSEHATHTRWGFQQDDPQGWHVKNTRTQRSGATVLCFSFLRRTTQFKYQQNR
ncbi:hypothetical protein JZ751_010808 [Albula glossodonta]|uniref:Uncharacterized protein n=1 Tax=Albula glossodonta TaxID=121402 RepID=A0A8T2N7B3_9TELE|nr:hypothetical protein JZ751_010808 [Albula glossodonta]